MLKLTPVAVDKHTSTDQSSPPMLSNSSERAKEKNSKREREILEIRKREKDFFFLYCIENYNKLLFIFRRSSWYGIFCGN